MNRFPRPPRLLVLGLASLLSSAAAGAGLAGAGLAEPMLAAHNQVRAEVAVPPLQWSETLALGAAQHARHLADNGCRPAHSGQRELGENVYWSSPNFWADGTTSVKEIAPEMLPRRWATERADYDLDSATCRVGKVCGHWTQVVWRATQALGCGVAICPDNGQIWVCRYSPPGNIIGERPF
jgi:pathogenesis-related protein 1